MARSKHPGVVREAKQAGRGALKFYDNMARAINPGVVSTAKKGGRDLLKFYDNVSSAVGSMTGVPRRIAGSLVGEKRNLTDRAKRYRAQNNVTGEKKCVICGSEKNIDVMHLDGNESHGEPDNLAYGCRSCNGKLAAAFKRIGAGVKTRQYNPASKEIPSFAQYAWAVSNHSRGAHDEAGKIIHATPKRKRIEYAKKIAGIKSTRRTSGGDDMPDWVNNPVKVTVRESSRRKGQFDVFVGGVHRVTKPTLKGAEAFAERIRKANPRNPESQAAAMYESFHGKPSTSTTIVEEEVHEHEWLAILGVLVNFKVATLSGFDVTVGTSDEDAESQDFDESAAKEGTVFLAANETGTQLYFKGGDQSFPLDKCKMGERSDWYRDDMIIGVLYEITYRTKKKFDKFQLTDYYHELGEETGDQPMLRYDPLSPHLYVSGGKYKIKMPMVGMSPGIEN